MPEETDRVIIDYKVWKGTKIMYEVTCDQFFFFFGTDKVRIYLLLWNIENVWSLWLFHQDSHLCLRFHQQKWFKEFRIPVQNSYRVKLMPNHVLSFAFRKYIIDTTLNLVAFGKHSTTFSQYLETLWSYVPGSAYISCRHLAPSAAAFEGLISEHEVGD